MRTTFAKTRKGCALGILNMGPDGFLIVQGLIVSALVALLAWRRVGLPAGLSATLVVIVALVIWQSTFPGLNPDIRHRIIAISFVVVPSMLLFGASRLRWMARHAWVVLLVGPLFFVGCYGGICELCVKTHLI